VAVPIVRSVVEPACVCSRVTVPPPTALDTPVLVVRTAVPEKVTVSPAQAVLAPACSVTEAQQAPVRTSTSAVEAATSNGPAARVPALHSWPSAMAGRAVCVPETVLGPVDAVTGAVVAVRRFSSTGTPRTGSPLWRPGRSR
jgi:hypothetical protein